MRLRLQHLSRLRKWQNCAWRAASSPCLHTSVLIALARRHRQMRHLLCLMPSTQFQAHALGPGWAAVAAQMSLQRDVLANTDRLPTHHSWQGVCASDAMCPTWFLSPPMACQCCCRG